MRGREDPIQWGETPDYGSCIWRWCYHIRQRRNEHGCGTYFWMMREWMYIETLDAVYEDIESLSKMLILCDVDNILRIARHKMYWKYVIGGCKRIFLNKNTLTYLLRISFSLPLQYMYVRINICINMYINICINVYVNVCINVRTNVWTYV